ncbi:MAG TPA: hypothetical protein DCE41_33740 [Cytophagales bacterium]|nr:hypothetical protein [Cytophagales bacterium]HAA19304.1 hypothetical protein [Cytophagales bacterium]HAP60083.1 hypothetical protein [Cytophagales bacterium]
MKKVLTLLSLSGLLALCSIPAWAQAESSSFDEELLIDASQYDLVVTIDHTMTQHEIDLQEKIMQLVNPEISVVTRWNDQEELSYLAVLVGDLPRGFSIRPDSFVVMFNGGEYKAISVKSLPDVAYSGEE